MHLPIYQLLYTSKTTHPLGHRSDLDILKAAMHHNAQNELTGFLFRDAENFYQVLEGPEIPLRQAMQKISNDPRHHTVQIVYKRLVTERQFGQWSMGYAPAEKPVAEKLKDICREGVEISAASNAFHALTSQHSGSQMH